MAQPLAVRTGNRSGGRNSLEDISLCHQLTQRPRYINRLQWHTDYLRVRRITVRRCMLNTDR